MGFSGSRSCSVSQWRAVELAVSGLCGQSVSVGCAAGVDELVGHWSPLRVSSGFPTVVSVVGVRLRLVLWLAFARLPSPVGCGFRSRRLPISVAPSVWFLVRLVPVASQVRGLAVGRVWLLRLAAVSVAWCFFPLFAPRRGCLLFPVAPAGLSFSLFPFS